MVHLDQMRRSPGGTLRIAAAIADLAMHATSRAKLRAEVLRRLQVVIGFDSALFETYPLKRASHASAHVDIDATFMQRSLDGWRTYGRELAPLFANVLAHEGVWTDVRTFGAEQRARLAFYREVFVPLQVRESMCCVLPTRADSALVALVRRGRVGSRFPDAALATMRELLPLITLADRLVEHRAGATQRPPELLALLTPREREIVGLVELGFTNREIAQALGASSNTVRNHLAQVFRKCGASTRAELVGLMAGRV